MARPQKLKDTTVVSVRIELDMYQTMNEIANLESLMGNKTTFQELVRMACAYTYGDNEALRECFRRSRVDKTNRYKQKT